MTRPHMSTQGFSVCFIRHWHFFVLSTFLVCQLINTLEAKEGRLGRYRANHDSIKTCALALCCKFHVANDAATPLWDDEARIITDLTSTHDSDAYNAPALYWGSR